MNYCRRCQSEYEKPGTCNCFAPSQAAPFVPLPYVPYVPYAPPQPFYPPGTIYVGDLPGGCGTVTTTIDTTGGSLTYRVFAPGGNC